jgi:hypothetical protein
LVPVKPEKFAAYQGWEHATKYYEGGWYVEAKLDSGDLGGGGDHGYGSGFGRVAAANVK